MFAIVVRSGEGEARWWTGELATIKLAAGDTGGAFALVEIVAPPGLEIPLHVHRGEDETFAILHGGATFTVGAETIAASAGDVLFAPRDVPHAYVVGPEGCRMLFLFTPGGFEDFVRESSEPALAPTPPPRFSMPGPAQMEELCRRYEVELVA